MTNAFCLRAALARLTTSHNGMFRLAAAAYLKPPSHATVVPASGAGQRSPGGYTSSTVVLVASQPDGDPISDAGTPNQPGFRGVTSSSSLEGLAGSALFVFV